MKFKSYPPPSGGLRQLNSWLDDYESRTSIPPIRRIGWALVPISAVTLGFLVLHLEPSIEPTPSVLEFTSYYSKQKPHWSASSIVKEVETKNKNIRYFWYVAGSEERN